MEGKRQDSVYDVIHMIDPFMTMVTAGCHKLNV